MPLKRERAVSVDYNRHSEASDGAVEQIPSFWPAPTHELLVRRLRDILLYVKVDTPRNYVPDEEERNPSSGKWWWLMGAVSDPDSHVTTAGWAGRGPGETGGVARWRHGCSA